MPNQEKGKSKKCQNFELQSVQSVMMKLRSRIHKILDEQFCYWKQKIQKEKQFDSLTINESILEDWVEMFKNQVLIGKSKRNKYVNSIGPDKHTMREPMGQIKKISFPKPSVQSIDRCRKFIHKQNQDTIDFYQFDKSFGKNQWKLKSYQISQKKLKPFSSLTYSSFSHSIIIIGGHKTSNPNIKSSKISKLSLDTSIYSTISSLPYGLSSHAALSVYQHIYIIGGNKNHSIITRGCFKYNERQNCLQQISCLNYPVANANCILWKQKWIYKFGGIGEAFGNWDNSPYIERYSIYEDFWEVVNPVMNEKTVIMSEILLAKSNSYICSHETSIFVFGGYNIDGKLKQNGFVLKIQQNQTQQVAQHRIQQYGGIQCKQIIENGFAFIQTSTNQVQMYGLIQNCYDMSNKQLTLLHTFS